MSSFSEYLYSIAWGVGYIGYFVIPFALGIAICRSLRVKDFTAKTAWVLFSIFLAMAPFVNKIVQEERYGYLNDAKEWVTVGDVRSEIDPETKQPIQVDSKGKRVRRKELNSDEIAYQDGKWILALD